jgi:purine nucleoside permease
MKKLGSTILLACIYFNAFCLPDTLKTQGKIPVKVVVVTMFENGADEGDAPGEFQYWVERMPLNHVIPFPQGFHALRYNAEKHVLGICTGMGTARSAASVMALGMDPRFDLSKAYWMVAGIAGIDPEDGSVGSAVWSEWLVDGDLAHEIDPREAPADWPTGYLPLSAAKPYQLPKIDDRYKVAYHLNPALVNWAYNLTKNVQLKDNDKLQQFRAQYVGYPEAMKPPSVMMGDHLAAMTYWHGKLMNQWANDWVKYWTDGKGNFVTSAMEDTGTAQALTFLTQAGRADMNRYLVLRTASNYTMQYLGITAIESLRHEKHGSGTGYSAFIQALDAAYVTGIMVVDELSGNWTVYKDKLPGK